MVSVTISDLETILDRLHSVVKQNGEEEEAASVKLEAIGFEGD